MTDATTTRDVISSYLKEDTRILSSVLATRRIFEDERYTIHLCLYSGLMNSLSLNDDLVTALVIFKAEKVRAMVKLWTDSVVGSRDEYLLKSVQALREKMVPHQLIFQAKAWCHLPFDQADEQAFLKAGLSVRELKAAFKKEQIEKTKSLFKA